MAWYKTGTVTVTQNSTLVTGSGTTFLTSCAAGDLFTVDGSTVYEVASVTNNTSLALGRNYAEATAAGANYAIARLSTVSISTVDLANQVSSLLTSWQVRENQYKTWSGGNALSGFRVNGVAASPAGADSTAGYYPLTDLTGAISYVACPAKQAPTDTATFTGVTTVAMLNATAATVSGAVSTGALTTKVATNKNLRVRLNGELSLTAIDDTNNAFVPMYIEASAVTFSATAPVTISGAVSTGSLACAGSVTTSDSSAIGTTLKTWYAGANFKALQISDRCCLIGSSANVRLTNNAYYNASATPTYLTTGFAAEYIQDDSGHTWKTAVSSSGAITWVQNAQLSSTGLSVTGKILCSATTPVDNASGAILQVTGAASVTGVLTVSGGLSLALDTVGTAPAAGGAGALPASPAGYATIKINGVDRQIAIY